ncbi:hypothetical protein U0070_021225 [Myodes glareolus]|uniref:Uncharacterized protein n=1 Tax=Myodes glareolus TaxID=447135 RepID=A0AAW0HN10_MYOGA
MSPISAGFCQNCVRDSGHCLAYSRKKIKKILIFKKSRDCASSVVHLESIPIGFYRNSCGSSPVTAKMVKLI